MFQGRGSHPRWLGNKLVKTLHESLKTLEEYDPRFGSEVKLLVALQGHLGQSMIEEQALQLLPDASTAATTETACLGFERLRASRTPSSVSWGGGSACGPASS